MAVIFQPNGALHTVVPLTAAYAVTSVDIPANGAATEAPYQ